MLAARDPLFWSVFPFFMLCVVIAVIPAIVASLRKLQRGIGYLILLMSLFSFFGAFTPGSAFSFVCIGAWFAALLVACFSTAKQGRKLTCPECGVSASIPTEATKTRCKNCGHEFATIKRRTNYAPPPSLAETELDIERALDSRAKRASR